MGSEMIELETHQRLKLLGGVQRALPTWLIRTIRRDHKSR